MRKVLILLLLVGGVFGAGWVGGETYLAREAARRIADDPRIEASTVTPLRELSRIGLHLTDVAMDLPDGELRLPSLDLWAAPSSPTEFHASLPPTLILPLEHIGTSIGTTNGTLSMRFSPTSSMAISRAALATGPITINEVPLADALDGEAVLTAMSSGAPRDARASYLLKATLDRLAPGPAGLAEPIASEIGSISLDGTAQIYVTDPIRPSDPARPEVVGVATEGVTLNAGERSLRIAGRIVPDSQGFAQGALFIYTAAPRPWLELAAKVGAIPQNAVALAGTALQTAAATEVSLPTGVPAPPEPQGDELRIPVIFQNGTTSLGPLQLGPAPIFPR